MSNSDFGYLIIGDGTSGLVLAARLVEDPAGRVCVLEAGQDITAQTDIMVPIVAGFACKIWRAASPISTGGSDERRPCVRYIMAGAKITFKLFSQTQAFTFGGSSTYGEVTSWRINVVI
ncbi:hypothetical protein DFH06DRAFT_1186925 [Mycena polygramma]|nr:hypothetical protein DFH06DRAFT_1186925 [Mycena polygramma]